MRLPARYSPVGSFTADGRSFSVDGFHKKVYGRSLWTSQGPFLYRMNPRKPLFTGAFLVLVLYQLGNWKAGKTVGSTTDFAAILYQLGNWKAGKTCSTSLAESCELYQLGNWKAGKTSIACDRSCPALYQLGNWKAGKTMHRRPCRPCRLYQLGNWKAGKTFIGHG